MTRAVALFFAIGLAGTFANASGPGAGATTAARLTTITSHLHGKSASLVIEATEPVAYVATQPDPLTVLVEFRNVDAAGVASSVKAGGGSPIASVAVEQPDAATASGPKVRITLLQPVAHRVRSDRNTVVVDFDKAAANAGPFVLPSRSRTAPDAMLALERGATPADPIAALGLDKQAATTPSPTAAAVMRPAESPRAPAVQEPAQPPAKAPAPAAPAPSMPAQTGAIAVPPSGHKYSGNPVSLDFQGADLRAVLRTFAEISGLNMVIDPKVNGTVDVALRDVPWDQALDIILRANGLEYRVDGTIVRIAPREVFTAEDKSRSDAAAAQALAGDLVVLTKTLSYAKAEELRDLLTRSALSPRGTVQVDPRTNTLIISDLQERLQTASDLIATLDKPQPQVEIEARIVQTNKNYARQLGVQWGFNGKVDPALGNSTGLAFPASGSLGGLAGGGTSAPPPGTVANFAVPGAPSAIGLALGSINGAFNLDAALSALESSGNGRLLSTPKVSTLNNVAAEMTQGVQIPIQTVANNTVTVQFKDAALTLKVTPQITSANTVIMQISVENATPDFSRSVNNIPPINTQRANTTVLVSDGMTTVIGGIYTSTTTSNTDRTPGLGSLPLLKWLFKRDAVSDQNTELLIFITPRIIKG
ncbi:MAG TPA: type IV pilus secretin PilQ [Vicinamibacterales bacterium]|nr:type IV pilus secretin PilQ [Vicinamibacterales bacterium]